MYGSGYGSSYGGLGGMGGYSSYGGGLGGYGSSYGSTLGGYGSYNRPGLTASANGAVAGQNGEVGKDPNNPNQSNPEENHRKQIMQEYFKMMGGLKSILEMGFAVIALANFWSRSMDIFKKIFTFLAETSKKFLHFIVSKIPTKMVHNLIQAEKRPQALKNLLFMLLRVFAIVLIYLGLKFKHDIYQQVIKKQKELEEKLKEIKQEQGRADDQFGDSLPQNEGSL